MTSIGKPLSDSGPEAHLERIVRDVGVEVRAKYRAGQTEHGGRLWEKPGMLARLTQEHHDALVYGHTLREQLAQVALLLDLGDLAQARERLRAILTTNPTD